MKFVFFLIALIFAVCAFQNVAAENAPCKTFCTAIYQPICARDPDTNALGTYGNLCALEAARCTTKKNFAIVKYEAC